MSGGRARDAELERAARGLERIANELELANNIQLAAHAMSDHTAETFSAAVNACLERRKPWYA